MNENVKVIFGLIGGLALFLYGMNSMSDALQKAAGEKMKRFWDFLRRTRSWERLQEHWSQEIMGSVMKPLATSPVFTDLMGKVSSIPVLGVLLGAAMTLVVQSSSATIAVLQNFASQAGPDGVTSVIGLAGAIPILLGDNIGTTITALLASIGQSKNAKRTAIAHSIFNISGSFVFVWLIPWFAKFVQYISPKGNEVEVISRQIANAHTTFNVVCTLVWLPLIPLMVKIVTTIIPGKDKKIKAAYEPKYLDNKMIDQPVAAMYLVSQELENLAGFAATMLTQL